MQIAIPPYATRLAIIFTSALFVCGCSPSFHSVNKSYIKESRQILEKISTIGSGFIVINSVERVSDVEMQKHGDNLVLSTNVENVGQVLKENDVKTVLMMFKSANIEKVSLSESYGFLLPSVSLSVKENGDLIATISVSPDSNGVRVWPSAKYRGEFKRFDLRVNDLNDFVGIASVKRALSRNPWGPKNRSKVKTEDLK